MEFYNKPFKSGDLAAAISDCYQLLGRRATIGLLDNMNQLGFREAFLSGLSFATDDVVATAAQYKAAGVEFVQDPKVEPWGTSAIFKDSEGNQFVLSSSE